MCRAKAEGPRCSYGGEVRVNRAEKYEAKINQKAAQEMASKGKLSSHTEWQLRNVTRRNIAARNVYYATPRGQNSLRDEIAIEEQRIASNPLKTSKDKAEANASKRNIKNLSATLDRGIRNRKMMYRCEKLAGAEKRQIREKSMAQGGNTNVRAQKAYKNEVDAIKNLDEDTALSLQEWKEEDIKEDASLWTKERTGWEANDKTKPPANVEVTNAKGVKTKVDTSGEAVVPSRSNIITMATPDGSYAEARYDIHVRKNKKGQYVVSQRYIAASDWRDIGPMDEPPADTVEQKAGHLLASKKGRVSRRDKVSAEVFTSKAKAIEFATKAKRSISQKASVNLALDSRTALINRARKAHGAEPLTKVGRQGGRHLYSEAGYEGTS